MSVKEQYERNGYAIIRNVLDKELIQEASAHVDWLIRKYPDTPPEHFHSDLVEHDAFWLRLVSDDRLLDIAEQFVGPDIALFGSQYLCKAPFTPDGNAGEAVLWHQDGSYWPLEPVEVITIWLAVSDSTPENGCMRIIPGTHTLDLQEMQARTDVTSVLSSSIDESWVEEDRAVDLVLGAGDVSIHHPHIIHGSEVNESDQWRRGLTIRYIPTTTRITGDWPIAFLLRGNAVPGINEYMPFPKYIAGEHNAFRGSDEWNQRIDEKNGS